MSSVTKEGVTVRVGWPYTQSELDAIREAEEDLNDDVEEDEDDRVILGYVCMCCGGSQAHYGWGECNKCCGPLEEWLD